MFKPAESHRHNAKHSKSSDVGEIQLKCFCFVLVVGGIVMSIASECSNHSVYVRLLRLALAHQDLEPWLLLSETLMGKL